MAYQYHAFVMFVSRGTDWNKRLCPTRIRENVMKKGLIIAIFSALLLTLSGCKKEESLVGTSWVYYYDSSRSEGSTIRFVTETVAYLTDWEYEHGEYVEDVEQVNYMYTAPNGVFYKNGGSISFTISGESLLISGVGDGGRETLIFTKQ